MRAVIYMQMCEMLTARTGRTRCTSFYCNKRARSTASEPTFMKANMTTIRKKMQPITTHATTKPSSAMAAAGNPVGPAQAQGSSRELFVPQSVGGG